MEWNPTVHKIKKITNILKNSNIDKILKVITRNLRRKEARETVASRFREYNEGRYSCHTVGINGGCGYECIVFKCGDCPEPPDMDEYTEYSDFDEDVYILYTE
jgi:hypothetical protein